ncbi:zinc finger protein family member, putative [Trypanosoma equiperdum]|uniref:C3H1-type domain-containing protein n=2 Tax=Trypanozoon TaxID=39700 RepID=Q38B78_TRYB2|nr:hypothetical protein, conserved [Trypanosoma brucei brucei TREU927]EAN77942.1 hypothetical protein, conserved [Trypanosoma brucei brucei TREU927]SCU65439.1 zinc finger protein family member, putative [Trypanosoma equiperdum]
MSGTNHLRQVVPAAVYNPIPPAPPFMVFCDPYAKVANATAKYRNQPPVAPNAAAVFQQQLYSLPFHGVAGVPAPMREEEDADGSFEVHDSCLKAPITVGRRVVIPTTGSRGLFNCAQLPSNGNSGGNCNNNSNSNGNGGKSFARICDAHPEGRCISGEQCPDIHVQAEYLTAQRQEMIFWLESKEREFQNTLRADPTKMFRVFCADLKEAVEVPISALQFTKGLYVDPSVRARRARAGHQNQFAMLASQLPTACGLFLSNPSQCRWARWCNQIHVDFTWMQTKKKEFESWFNELEGRFNALPDDYEFHVHDPQLKMGLRIPKASIAVFSRGLFQGSPKKAPSVCMLFQRDRCTANVCCNQIHVIPRYLALHRLLIQKGDSITEEERGNIMNQMKEILESQKRSMQVADDGDANFLARELNPQAVPYVPPQPTSVWRTGGSAGSSSPPRTAAAPIPVPEPLPTFRQPPQWNEHSPSAAVDGSPYASPHRRVERCGSSGTRDLHTCSNPLEDLIEFVDGDKSRTSLLASQSTTSQASRSCKHTNNPYAFGASYKCTASPTFGWVQPVYSAANSGSTHPANRSWGSGSVTGGCQPIRVRVGGGGIMEHEPLEPFSLDQHDMGASPFECRSPAHRTLGSRTIEDRLSSSPTWSATQKQR